MSFTDHFAVVDDAIGPQPWMQLRAVATKTVASVAKNYDPADGWAKADLMQTLQIDWTNDTPVSQWVYGLMTKTGSQMTLQCRSRAYLSTRHGVKIAASGSNIPMIEVSKFGCGADLGNGGLLMLGGAYGINEYRQNTVTMPFMPHLTQWFLLAPGDTIHAKVDVYFISEFWENTQIDGGDGDTESKVITGDLNLDLFAVPTVAVPPPRTIPSIVGGAGNIKYDVNTDLGLGDTRASVNIPTGLQAGDILVAVVCNQLGLGSDIQPVESGWTLLHSRNEGAPLDVHMKVWMRAVTNPATLPAHYSFENGILAEEIAVLIPIRGSVPYDDANGLNWYVASNVSRFQLRETHIAPSIEREGQLLLAVSYFAHTPIQSPITQTVPAGMTELLDHPMGGSTLAIAALTDPPFPTKDREFTPSQWPWFTGHSITASILIPGSQGY